MKKILITDSLFIYKEHEDLLRAAGFDIVRLDKPEATEDELIEALRGCQGYILGGIEKVTDRVLENAEGLEAIVFTGADWINFIPGHQLATAKGIAIANTPKANAFGVAEYTVSLILAMTRRIFELGNLGDKTFMTTKSLRNQTVGIVGLGAIGEMVVKMLKPFEVNIVYNNRTRKTELEEKYNIQYLDLDTLVSQSDIVSLHASKEIGNKYFNKNYLSKMKDGALLVNCSFENAVDIDDVYEEVKSARIACAQDGAVDSRFKDLSPAVWFNSNAHTAYNTKEANKVASDMAAQSMINLLGAGKDSNKVN